MSRTFTTVIVFLSLLLLADYASSTKMKSFWKDPSATASSLQFKKVLVMAIIQQPFTRKVAEDKAVSIIESGGTAHAVPSYTIIGDDELDNKELAKSKIEGMDFDGVIVMKYAGSKDQRKYDEEDSQWSSYTQFWGAYGAAWGGVYNAQTTNDLTVFIETLFYSLKEDKLVWAGISETKNPKNPAKVVADIAEETAKYLQKQGLIGKKKE
jgi:hypothetical protein